MTIQKNKAIIALGSVLALLLVGLTVLLVLEKKTNRELVEEFQLE